MLNIFVSGLERQTGKTLVTAGIAATMQSLSYPTSVYKPIQAGAVMMNGFKSSPDITLIKRIDPNIYVSSTYILKGEDCPFVASYEDGLKIDINAIISEYRSICEMTDCNIVEGANSISTPICANYTELDVARALNLPILLIVNPRITPIDIAISALKYITSENYPLVGVIVNQYNEQAENLEEKYYPQILKEYFNIKILGTLPDYGNISALTPEALISDVLNNINIEELFGLQISKLS